MKEIKIDNDIYEHLCRHTSEIGETASSILRRLLKLTPDPANPGVLTQTITTEPISPRVLPSSSWATPTPSVPPVERPRAFPPAPPHEGVSDRVAELLLKLSRLRTKQVVDRFIEILNWIHEQETAKFDCAKGIRGRTRIYFSRDKQEIENSGRSTFPVQIGESGWFVSTNNSTDNKREIIDQLLRLLNFPRKDRELIVQALEPDSKSPNPASRFDLEDIGPRPIEDTDDIKI